MESYHPPPFGVSGARGGGRATSINIVSAIFSKKRKEVQGLGNSRFLEV